MWDKQRIQALLAQNDAAVARAVTAIYAHQTADEQAIGDTKYDNGVGFSSSDAKRGQYYAGYISSRGCLTGRHLEIARKMMSKYHRQLAEIANSKAAFKQPVETKQEWIDPEEELVRQEIEESVRNFVW